MIIRSLRALRGMSLLVVSLFTMSIISTDVLRISQAEAAEIMLPAADKLLAVSQQFSAPLLKGVRFNPKDPLNLEFVFDSANEDNVSKTEAQKLVHYFLAGVTIPEKDLWVNLSPYEKDRIAEEHLSTTELGRDLLAQDYVLKQLSSSLTYPDSETGQTYWDVLRSSGYDSNSTDSFNKIWITPDVSRIYESESGTEAYILEATLDVMTENDYLASEQKGHSKQDSASSKATKDVLLPVIKKEVNYGKNFSNLRQMYNSILLGIWFKKKFAETFYKSYIDSASVKGIDLSDESSKELIFQRYVEAFEKGVFNYKRKERDPQSGRLVKRQYFSGGFNMITDGSNNVTKLEIIIGSSFKAAVEFLKNLINPNEEVQVRKFRFDSYSNKKAKTSSSMEQSSDELIGPETDVVLGMISAEGHDFYVDDTSYIVEYINNPDVDIDSIVNQMGDLTNDKAKNIERKKAVLASARKAADKFREEKQSMENAMKKLIEKGKTPKNNFRELEREDLEFLLEGVFEDLSAELSGGYAFVSEDDNLIIEAINNPDPNLETLVNGMEVLSSKNLVKDKLRRIKVIETAMDEAAKLRAGETSSALVGFSNKDKFSVANTQVSEIGVKLTSSEARIVLDRVRNDLGIHLPAHPEFNTHNYLEGNTGNSAYSRDSIISQIGEKNLKTIEKEARRVNPEYSYTLKTEIKLTSGQARIVLDRARNNLGIYLSAHPEFNTHNYLEGNTGNSAYSRDSVVSQIGEKDLKMIEKEAKRVNPNYGKVKIKNLSASSSITDDMRDVGGVSLQSLASSFVEVYRGPVAEVGLDTDSFEGLAVVGVSDGVRINAKELF